MFAIFYSLANTVIWRSTTMLPSGPYGAAQLAVPGMRPRRACGGGLFQSNRPMCAKQRRAVFASPVTFSHACRLCCRAPHATSFALCFRIARDPPSNAAPISHPSRSSPAYGLHRTLTIFISVTSSNEPRLIQSIDVELSKWPDGDGDVWFPKQVRFRDVHGERVDSEETVTVVRLSALSALIKV